AMRGGRIVCDAPPAAFLEWALAEAPELATPGARLLAGAGLRPASGVKAARAALRDRGRSPGAGACGPRGAAQERPGPSADAAVLGDPAAPPPAVVCLDEPTRGMDRRLKGELAALLRRIEPAVLVATHDPEFVAEFADRVVLLADGAPIADGPTAEILATGTYFATETARIL